MLRLLHISGKKQKSAQAMQNSAFQKMPEQTRAGRGTDNEKVKEKLPTYNKSSFLWGQSKYGPAFITDITE